jgi:hypothetical protein
MPTFPWASVGPRSLLSLAVSLFPALSLSLFPFPCPVCSFRLHRCPFFPVSYPSSFLLSAFSAFSLFSACASFDFAVQSLVPSFSLSFGERRSVGRFRSLHNRALAPFAEKELTLQPPDSLFSPSTRSLGNFSADDATFFCLRTACDRSSSRPFTRCPFSRSEKVPEWPVDRVLLLVA